jgi:hypothetical protein
MSAFYRQRKPGRGDFAGRRQKARIDTGAVRRPQYQAAFAIAMQTRFRPRTRGAKKAPATSATELHPRYALMNDSYG